MEPLALHRARYWRNSLADAELGRGAFRRKDVSAMLAVPRETLLRGRVGEKVIDALFSGELADADSLDVTLRPLVYHARTTHARNPARLPDLLTPIVGKGTLKRDGTLAPSSVAVVPRDLLEPLDRSAFTIGTVDALDDFLTRNGHRQARSGHPDGAASWDGYLDHCRALAEAVFPALAGDGRFERVAFGLIDGADGQRGAGRALGALYDHILAEAPSAPLFATFAAQPEIEPQPCLPPEFGFAARGGHSSDHYALADAQRGALSHILAARHGEVVAVNGPPGTGKTTLLLSVVASLWIEAALAGDEPPIVIAASANNQAVTNIIDAFGSDFAAGDGPFAGRWLPEVTSFGSYFPASAKRKEAERRGYLGPAFFSEVEQADSVDRARTAFLDAARRAFPHDGLRDVAGAVASLHARLVSKAEELAAIAAAWGDIVESRAAIEAALGPDPDRTIAQHRSDAARLGADLERAEELAASWDRHRGGEPVLLSLFGWLAPIAARRLASARAALRPCWPGAWPPWARVGEIGPSIDRLVANAVAARDQAEKRLTDAEATMRAGRDATDRWRGALAPVGIAPDEAHGTTLTDCDTLADTNIRFPLFQTAVHYWEGRWLLDMAAIPDAAEERKRAGRKALIARWRRWMKLTPCAVSTFYMLPGLMRARRHRDGDFVDDYLYDTADLLIVDEAGQVTPEVGGASFALARRALVIGDTAQIAPIWSVPECVDIGNRREAGLLATGDEREARCVFDASGRAAASGSVMHVARHVSRYHQDPDLARGLMLYEHRRCFDEIVGYCNDLCYAGKLVPLRGRKPRGQPDGLPAMGFLHIDGLCEPLPGGSRRNRAEAVTIAAWILANRHNLEAAYPRRSLSAILGIVTPFAGQVRAIRDALVEAGIETSPDERIAVGSVHAFQGGQRPVMLFSPTYSKHADGGFIDDGPNMLNVAVSRAMDSFLVFGDMDCFSTAPAASPRGRLAARLFVDDANALAFGPVVRRDLDRRARIEHLRDGADHDRFLRQTLAARYRDIHIVTPWLTWRALRDSEIMPGIAAAIGQGKTLTVYTDPVLNAGRSVKDAAAAADFDQAVAALREVGVDLVKVRRVHSKIVIADDVLYCVGSFNWLSAARSGAFERHETSLAYFGKAVAGEIDAMKDSLNRRTCR